MCDDRVPDLRGCGQQTIGTNIQQQRDPSSFDPQLLSLLPPFPLFSLIFPRPQFQLFLQKFISQLVSTLEKGSSRSFRSPLTIMDEAATGNKIGRDAVAVWV